MSIAGISSRAIESPSSGRRRMTRFGGSKNAVFSSCWCRFATKAETGSCHRSVMPASAMRSVPLTIITEATKRSTGRTRSSVGRAGYTLTALGSGDKETLKPVTQATTAPTTHQKLLAWVEQATELAQPDEVHWCDGSAEEYDRLCRQLVEAGTFERLSDAKRPNSYLARSNPQDVARVEDRTFICS